MSETKKTKICPPTCVSDAVVGALEAGFAILAGSDSTSLLKRFLTGKVLEKLKTKKTSYGATLLDCISPGIEKRDLVIGIYAADPECYEVFADLFLPIINEYHRIERNTIHPGTNWGTVTNLGDVDPEGKYIVSTGVKCCRNLKGYPFSALMTEANYEEIESKMSHVLKTLPGELRGTYHSLAKMPKSVRDKFIVDYYFKEGVRLMQATNAREFWPSGRGVYLNHKKNFVLWIGEEDHVTILSKQPGGNVGEVFTRLIMALNHIEKRIKFSSAERLGYLTSCPSNLGHAIRPYFIIQVPKLAAADLPKLQALAGKHEMQVKEAAKEPTNCEGLYELCNATFFGCTEHHCVKQMCLGITEIIEAEKRTPNLDFSKKYCLEM